jgi:Ca2+/Na+ antiporter
VIAQHDYDQVFPARSIKTAMQMQVNKSAIFAAIACFMAAAVADIVIVLGITGPLSERNTLRVRSAASASAMVACVLVCVALVTGEKCLPQAGANYLRGVLRQTPPRVTSPHPPPSG